MNLITRDNTITEEQRAEMRRQKVVAIFAAQDKKVLSQPRKRPCYCDYSFHPEGC